MIHRRTHPDLDVEGCFGCKIAGVSFSSIPGGTRRGGAFALSERKIKKDLEVYDRARKSGLRPESSTVEGVERAERMAESRDRAMRKLGTDQPELDAMVQRVVAESTPE